MQRKLLGYEVGELDGVNMPRSKTGNCSTLSLPFFRIAKYWGWGAQENQILVSTE